ncbi:hypothetical protein JCM11641_000566 [Rhodosporidiobolus odoratus]
MAEQDSAATVSRHLRHISLDASISRNLTAPTSPTSIYRPSTHSELPRQPEHAVEDGHEVQGVEVDALPDADNSVEGGFEAVSLDEGAQAGASGWRDDTDAPRSSSSPSPAPTSSTPPLSASTTPATTIADPSTSSISVTPSSATSPGPGKPADASPTSTSSAATSSAEGPASPAPSESPQKKQNSTRIPTIMQRVVSMTRPRQLPPKPKEEEEKHLRELAEMRAASRAADLRRKSAVEQRKVARAIALAVALPQWETSILPNWRVVQHEDAQGRALRRLWVDGTMPVRHRGRLWALAIGNGLAVPKSAFGVSQETAKRLEDEGRLEEVRRAAEEDVEGTLPTLKLFQKGGVMHDELMELLLVWSVYEKSKPRYPKGLAYPAALLLVNMPVAEAFVSLVNLVEKSFLRSFYAEAPDEREAYYRTFDTLLADFLPRVYNNFSSLVLRPSLYLTPWLTTLFAAFLPLDLSTRIFDVFLLEGDSFPFRVALILLQILEPRLFNPNSDELASLFAGEDRGAVAIVRREKGLLTPDGGALEEREGGVKVEVEDVYGEMGVEEDRVFDGLGRMEWKEETWARLIERELPEAV